MLTYFENSTFSVIISWSRQVGNLAGRVGSGRVGLG